MCFELCLEPDGAAHAAYLCPGMLTLGHGHMRWAHGQTG